VFLGNKAKPYAKYISKNNYKFFAVHPAAAAYKGGVWNSGDLFNQINVTVDKLYGEKIEW
jgi:uracil DNA glycosylase